MPPTLPQPPCTQTAQKRPPKLRAAEWRRLQALTIHESAARQSGFSCIAGVDEAGRGCLAGPVVAAACIIPEDIWIAGINDSKQLTPMRRCELFEQMHAEERIKYAIGVISHEQIDQINIYQATLQAMLGAVSGLSSTPDLLLVDGMSLPHPNIPCKKIIRGDQLSYLIAAASIIAKEMRDRMMVKLHVQFPAYGFKKHKGYGTEEHLAAIANHGPSPIHRLSFSPFSKKGEEAGKDPASSQG